MFSDSLIILIISLFENEVNFDPLGKSRSKSYMYFRATKARGIALSADRQA